MSKQPETLKIASQIELATTCGFIGSAAQYENLLLSAVSHLRRLHARVEELESVAADHIAQDRKMVAAQETNGLLARIEKEISTAQINNHRMAAPFGKMEGEPCVRISSLLATIEGFLNEVNEQQTAAPVVLPEPDEYQYRMKPNWDDKLPWTPWEACSKESAANLRKRKKIHDWIYEVRERYTEQQVRAAIAAAVATEREAHSELNHSHTRHAMQVLPDGSAFAIYSYPLPKDHWLYAPREYEQDSTEPKELAAPILTQAHRGQVASAIRYAVRGATNCGKEDDFDPDALVLNAVYALCGPVQPKPQTQAAPHQADARDAELLKALGDLSFDCFDGFGAKAPSVEIYNRTFSVLEKCRVSMQGDAK